MLAAWGMMGLLLCQWQTRDQIQMVLSFSSLQWLLHGWITSILSLVGLWKGGMWFRYFWNWSFNLLQLIGILFTILLCGQAIEKVKTDKNDKPYQDVEILNVTVPKSWDVLLWLLLCQVCFPQFWHWKSTSRDGGLLSMVLLSDGPLWYVRTWRNIFHSVSGVRPAVSHF